MAGRSHRCLACTPLRTEIAARQAGHHRAVARWVFEGSGDLPRCLRRSGLGDRRVDLDTTIVGTVSPAHLQANLDALEHGPLPPDLYDEAKHRLAAGSEPLSARQ
jgi:hypothetical protein